ncbi:MAG TPA: type II secretion system protein N [Burkholderiaceae bacterium]|jgi:general secretion pathway protein N
MKARRWAVLGAGLGGLLALIAFAPASWLADRVATASNQHLLLSDARGSIWNGSAVVVLTGGADSRDATALPGRLQWNLHWQGLSILLAARQDCCINGELQLRLTPGWRKLDMALLDKPDWLVRWPAGLLAGLGTPWNTLQLDGSARMLAHDLRISWNAQGWQQTGEVDLDLLNLSSRVSPIAPLGNYRFRLNGGQLLLTTLDGALQLQGHGQLSAAGASFRGEASAAPGREAALDNLLNIMGQRHGARSIISLG